MEIPDLVRETLGGEEILAGVPIGDEDVVCATASRTLVYRSEGLLSDERIDAYPHSAERLELSEGRRKTTFKLTYVDGTKSFSVPSGHTREVLTLLLEGVLSESGVLAQDESAVGAFRFSELTLVIAERQMIRHIGETVWDTDFETYAYEDLTGLDFQQGSVATEIVATIDGRPQRIKTPREDARLVEETLKKAVFEFYDVASMDELENVVSPDPDEGQPDRSHDDDLSLGSDIDPLVTGDAGGATEQTDDGASAGGVDTIEEETGGFDTTIAEADQPAGNDRGPLDASLENESTRETPTAESDPVEMDTSVPADELATQEEVEALGEQVEELSEAIQRQNQLLKQQHNAISELVDQLRSR